MLQYHHSKLRVIFSDYLKLSADIPECNTRQFTDLHAVLMKTDLGFACISHRGSAMEQNYVKK